MSRLSKWLDFNRYSSLALSLGLLLTGSLYLGYHAGIWLDQKFASSPLFLVTALLLAGVYPLYAMVIKLRLLAEDERLNRTKSARQNLSPKEAPKNPRDG